jgi:hypothetical protein
MSEIGFFPSEAALVCLQTPDALAASARRSSGSARQVAASLRLQQIDEMGRAENPWPIE